MFWNNHNLINVVLSEHTVSLLRHLNLIDNHIKTIKYLTLLSLQTITVLPLTIVYFECTTP